MSECFNRTNRDTYWSCARVLCMVVTWSLGSSMLFCSAWSFFLFRQPSCKDASDTRLKSTSVKIYNRNNDQNFVRLQERSSSFLHTYVIFIGFHVSRTLQTYSRRSLRSFSSSFDGKLSSDARANSNRPDLPSSFKIHLTNNPDRNVRYNNPNKSYMYKRWSVQWRRRYVKEEGAEIRRNGKERPRRGRLSKRWRY